MSSRDWASNLRRELTDSAWDQALEDAAKCGRAIEVTLESGERFRGELRYAGREGAQAAGWFYVYWPDRHIEGTGWSRHTGTHGLLLNRDKVRAIRIYLNPAEQAE
jgi:hypothetical protein